MLLDPIAGGSAFFDWNVIDRLLNQVTEAKEVKEFGRLGAVASVKEQDSTGSMKTIGKMLVDAQAIANIIKAGENNRTRGDLKGNYGYQHEMILYAHKGRRHLFGSRDANILQFDKVPTQAMQHPTEKPVKLLEYLISKSTREGETVLDMFMGSGGTCVAAKQMNRNYIGIEIEATWFEVAKARLARSRTASGLLVTQTGSPATILGAGRPASRAAAVIVGTACSAM